MRNKGGLIILGTIAFLSSAAILSTAAEAQTKDAAAATPGQNEQVAGVSRQATAKIQDTAPVALKAVSKALVDAANLLLTDNAEWDKTLQELQLSIAKNPRDLQGAGKDISDCLIVLGKAADLLAPDSEARKSFRQQETVIREFASDAAVNSDPVARRTSAHFEQEGGEMHALTQAAEETRTRLLASIDLLSTENAQLEFNRAVSQVAASIKDAQVIVDNIKLIAASAQKLADDLDSFGKTTIDATTASSTKGLAGRGPPEGHRSRLPPHT